MKHVVPFYPVICQTPKEDFFRIGFDITGGEIVSVKNYSFFQIISKIWNQDVHAHGRGFPFPELCSIFAKKSVYTPHNNTIGKSWWTRFFRRLIFNKYDKIICQTEFGKRSFIKEGIDRKKILVIPSAVDYEFFSKPKDGNEFRRKYGLQKNEPFALSIGIRPLKNPDVIAEACQKAGIKSVMVGALNKEDLVKGWRMHHGFEWYLPKKSLLERDNVIFVGQIASHELLKAFDAATIFINSSDYESFGIAVYEAAAAGLPLCLPNYGSFEIFKDAALFHNCKNSDQLASNILKYLGDANLRKRNGRKGQKIAKQFDHKIIKAKFERFYHNFLRS